MLVEDRIIQLEGERDRLRATRNTGDSIRADRITELIDDLRKDPQTAIRLQDPSVKLNQSDLKFTKELHDEVNEDLGLTGNDRLYRWMIRTRIAYKDGDTTRYEMAEISQFLGSWRTDGGYEIRFDEPGPVGTAKTLEEAKQKLLDYINKKRR